MLTRKQHELVCFINDRLNDTGVSPSFEEMKDALDLPDRPPRQRPRRKDRRIGGNPRDRVTRALDGVNYVP